MWVCSASKVLSSEIQSEASLPPDPSPDLARPETRSKVEGEVNRSGGEAARGWLGWKQAPVRFKGWEADAKLYSS